MSEIVWTMLLIVTLNNQSFIAERKAFNNLNDCKAYALHRMQSFKYHQKSVTVSCAVEKQI